MRHLLRRFGLMVAVSLSMCVQRGTAQEPMVPPTVAPEAAATLSEPGMQGASAAPAAEVAPPSQEPPVPSPADGQANAASVDSFARRELAVRRELIDGHLQELDTRRSRLRIAGPIVLISVTGVIGTFFAMGSIAELTFLADTKRDLDHGSYSDYGDANDDGDVDRADLRQARRSTGAIMSIAVVHLGLAAFGGWWLGHRLSARHRLDAEHRKLELERRVIEIKLDLRADNGSAVGMVVGNF